MRILYIWDADYPWDIRTEKICKSLLKAGHSVCIAARNTKKEAVVENIDGIKIYRLNPYKNSKLNRILSFPAFFSPLWHCLFRRIILKERIDLIIVRDLPLAAAGIWQGKMNKKPVIFDMAEDYVSLIRDIWNDRKFQGLNFFVRNPFLASLVEKYVLENIDHILTVIDEASELLVRKGVSPDKITVVGNTPMLDVIKKMTFQASAYGEIRHIKNRYSAIYTGGIQMGRGIQTVIEALPLIIKEIPDFLFVVIGDGYATPTLHKMIQAESLSKYVFWKGWVGHNEIYSYIRACRVGLIPHFVSDHVNTTIPNKIFDYMATGIPVIASDAIPLKRIVNDEHCGLTFKSGNAQSLSDSIVKLYKNPMHFGENGKRSVTENYNWGIDEHRLITLINDIAR